MIHDFVLYSGDNGLWQETRWNKISHWTTIPEDTAAGQPQWKAVVAQVVNNNSYLGLHHTMKMEVMNNF